MANRRNVLPSVAAIISSFGRGRLLQQLGNVLPVTFWLSRIARQDRDKVLYCSAQGLGCGSSGASITIRASRRLTSRSSRRRFGAQITWQIKLAMCFTPLRGAA